MHIIHDITEWQTLRSSLIGPLGFVPTMGNLHAGHMSLLNKARSENDHVLLSIFVNPTQFDDKNDFSQYPRTLDKDIQIAKKASVDYLLLPNPDNLYPDHYHYQVQETAFSHQLCGAHRPGHFIGVLTIVLKLLLIAKAHTAYFGEKDYQQYQLISDMAKAFFIDTAIISCHTVRNEEGLALSSRNTHFDEKMLKKAARFPQLLQSENSLQVIKETLTAEGFKIDYIEDIKNRRFAAVTLNGVRLIDNIEVFR